MISLVGCTGFVGSNICEQFKFQGLYNSENISESFGTNPDLLVYAGVKAEKFLANSQPEKDFISIQSAYENIKKISPKKLVLISTIDVYKNPKEVNEDTAIDINNLHAYGLNRYKLEQMIEGSGIDYLIIRLPGLFGKNIKKNFIFDLINKIPTMLKEDKFKELLNNEPKLINYYEKFNSGFYKVKGYSKELKDIFNTLQFNAINLTDSRAIFQFYNLANLWKDINFALSYNIKILNIATEPIAASEIYDFKNEISLNPPYYDFRTKYAKSGYLYDKKTILKEINEFIMRSQ
ncbi:MAG: NAD-dependent epimerase/dehydratase family protein [Endomicrobium sp.]|jgi:hypothetical protein|uniref:NAD-dependent epimerase/dehydratase family protein n=1 Tax=Candidatus Endomicrobiellum cubanum TaxID=3242325 RepID=UPI00281FA6F4|nr:NAD-dependent epimerase/dehydratase family protein [Endomicrobium sp.]